MLRRIDVVEAAGEHGDGAAVERRLVRGRVDAAGEPEAMTKPAPPMPAANMRASFWPAAEPLRAPTMASDRPRQVGDVALDVEQRRRRLEGGKRGRVAGLDGEQRARADPVARPRARPRPSARGQMRIACAPAAPRQLGQRRQRLLGAAEVIDELAEGDGADIVAADQPQARQPLGSHRAEPAAAGPGVRRVRDAAWAQDRAPILLSSPASRRRMLPWCLTKIRIAMMRMNSRPAWPRSEVVEHDGDGRRQRRQRGIARGGGHRGPHQAEDDGRRPMQAEQHADEGGNALAADEAQPDRDRDGRGRRRGRRRRTAGRHRSATKRLAISWTSSTATVPFSRSSSSVAAASPLRPVRSTLVAPMLPEPILRTSPRPAACVSSRPNGMEPSR